MGIGRRPQRLVDYQIEALQVELILYLVVILQAITYPHELLQHFQSPKIILEFRHSVVVHISKNELAKLLLLLLQIHFLSQKII